MLSICRLFIFGFRKIFAEVIIAHFSALNFNMFIDAFGSNFYQAHHVFWPSQKAPQIVNDASKTNTFWGFVVAKDFPSLSFRLRTLQNNSFLTSQERKASFSKFFTIKSSKISYSGVYL